METSIGHFISDSILRINLFPIQQIQQESRTQDYGRCR